MAVRLIANYSKRLGLPGYSSHQFSVSVETELRDVQDVEGESHRLYQLLQQNVDAQIQDAGFVPGDGYGGDGTANGSAPRASADSGSPRPWRCSPKQRRFIEQIVRENRLDPKEVAALADELFTLPVQNLNRMQASGLIDALLDQAGKKGGRQ
jgi:hypothetical protein